MECLDKEVLSFNDLFDAFEDFLYHFILGKLDIVNSENVLTVLAFISAIKFFDDQELNDAVAAKSAEMLTLFQKLV